MIFVTTYTSTNKPLRSIKAMFHCHFTWFMRLKQVFPNNPSQRGSKITILCDISDQTHTTFVCVGPLKRMF